MILNIKLEGQRLSVVNPAQLLADGSVGKIKILLQPDAEWDGLAVTMIFRRVFAIGADARSVIVTDVSQPFDVPHEVLHTGWLYIGAVGVAAGGTVRLTTAKMTQPLRVLESEDTAADPSADITPAVADQILGLIGVMSNLDTKKKESLVAAINEVLGEIPTDYVKTVNQQIPSANGDVQLSAKDILTSVQALQYQGDIEGALAALAAQPAAVMPIARANSEDGIAYTATGEDLPEVRAGNGAEQISHKGKGRQIIFEPEIANSTNAPTLAINGGEFIPIRLRAPQNQSADEQAPDATLPVPAGTLMRGVPYTMTFCGKYWLVDSQIAPVDIAGDWAEIETFEPTKEVNGSIELEKDGTSMTLPIPNVLATVAYVEELVPPPTAADAGKVLTASATGRAQWTAVANAEEVAV